MSACGGGSSSPSSSGATPTVAGRQGHRHARCRVRRHRQVRSDHEQENYTRRDPRFELAFGGSAWSQIPATAPYNTDPQNEYVQDQTSDGISNLNMVLCIVHGMSLFHMVNAGLRCAGRQEQVRHQEPPPAEQFRRRILGVDANAQLHQCSRSM